MSPLSELFEGKTFGSFEEIENLVSRLKNECFFSIKVFDSETITKYNVGKSDAEKLHEKWRFKYVKFVCTHFGKPRSQSKGIRQNQHVFPCECTFFFRVAFQPAKNQFKVTSLCLDHKNHKISAELKNDYHRTK